MPLLSHVIMRLDALVTSTFFLMSENSQLGERRYPFIFLKLFHCWEGRATRYADYTY